MKLTYFDTVRKSRKSSVICNKKNPLMRLLGEATSQAINENEKSIIPYSLVDGWKQDYDLKHCT